MKNACLYVIKSKFPGLLLGVQYSTVVRGGWFPEVSATVAVSVPCGVISESRLYLGGNVFNSIGGEREKNRLFEWTSFALTYVTSTVAISYFHTRHCKINRLYPNQFFVH